MDSIIHCIFFEINSVFGRIFLNSKPRLNNNLNLLHFSCGKNFFLGWVNAGFFPNVFPFFFKLSKYRKLPDWMIDLRFPLNCPDKIWDGVFTEHTLEHLNFTDVRNLLSELYRTMKKGAWIRIVVPDLDKYLKFYSGTFYNANFKKFENVCDALHFLTQKNGHRSIWNEQHLTHYLKNAGFANIRNVEFGSGTDLKLTKDQEVRKWESLYIEAQKL